jgi:hypothetical protein
MNERIRELARQAGLIAPYGSDREGLRDFDYREFAELIVKECGNWFNNRLVVNPDYGIEHRVERNRAVVGVMKEFNQHFGVEE